MEQVKLIIVVSGTHAQQLRDLADKECLPMTIFAKQIILKYLAAQQSSTR